MNMKMVTYRLEKVSMYCLDCLMIYVGEFLKSFIGYFDALNPKGQIVVFGFGQGPIS